MNKQDKELLEKSVNPFTTDLTIPVRVFKTIRKIVDVQDIQEGIITTVPDQLVSKVLIEDAEYWQKVLETTKHLDAFLVKVANALLAGK